MCRETRSHNPVRPEGTAEAGWFCGHFHRPFRTDSLLTTPPDTSCLANFHRRSATVQEKSNILPIKNVEEPRNSYVCTRRRSGDTKCLYAICKPTKTTGRIYEAAGIREENKMTPNHLAGVGAGRSPEFIEMMQVGLSHKSGSARFVGR